MTDRNRYAWCYLNPACPVIPSVSPPADSCAASPLSASPLPVFMFPRFRRASAGFTLIELLIVIVILGLLAALVIPSFANTKGKANVARVKSDLHNLATAQESYFYERAAYAPSMALLNVTASSGVTLTIVEASANGWSATAVHPATVPVNCALYYGAANPVTPATVPGQVACR